MYVEYVARYLRNQDLLVEMDYGPTGCGMVFDDAVFLPEGQRFIESAGKNPWLTLLHGVHILSMRCSPSLMS